MTIVRQRMLLFAVALVACAGEDSEPAATAAPERTNLVLVSIDTLRADALGTYRPGLSTSPVIDGLAREGVVFEQCMSAAPSTLPSHTTILTGLQPYAHGIRSNYGYVLPKEVRTLAEVARDAGYNTGAEIAADVLERRRGLDQGFGHYRDLLSYDVKLKAGAVNAERNLERVELKERPADDISKRGIEFLRANQNTPFFLWLHYFDPHQSYLAPREFAERFPDSPYHAEVAFADSQLGRVLDEIRRLGLRDRTLVVITSDHGEGLGEHGEGTHSYFVYETTQHVPLVLWGAGLPEGRRVGQLVRNADIAPTVLDWMGLAALPDTQGVSLRPLIEGDDSDLGLTGYAESIESFATFGTSVLRTLRSGHWKYIHKVNPELYDLASDPHELENRVSQEMAAHLKLRSQLEALLRESGGPRAATEVEVDTEMLEQLNALGYVGSQHRPAVQDQLEGIELRGVDPVVALDDLGVFSKAYGALRQAKDPVRAAEMFRQLYERYPESVPILRGLIDSGEEGPPEPQVPLMQRALELEPQDVILRARFARLLRDLGRADEALPHAQEVVAARPCGVVEIAVLSNVLSSLARYADQRTLLRERIERCDKPSLKNEYAYMLATCPDAEFRDGVEAVRLAEEITRDQGASDPHFMDTLAAAYAEIGDFERGAQAARTAVSLLERRDDSPEVIEAYRANLASIEAGKPIRTE